MYFDFKQVERVFQIAIKNESIFQFILIEYQFNSIHIKNKASLREKKERENLKYRAQTCNYSLILLIKELDTINN